MTYNFSHKEEAQIADLFKNGMLLSEIAKIFTCSESPIRRILNDFLGKEQYQTITKEHLRKSSAKNFKKAREASAKLPRNENQIKASQENLKKAWSLSRSEKQIEASRENFKGASEVSHSLSRSEKQKEQLKKAREVAATLPRSDKQKENVKKMHKALAQGIWQSSWEDNFFLKCLTKMFFPKDIERQYYLKGLNHAFDFAIPKSKLLFEIDGDYWHSKIPERDVKIDNFAKSEGWSVLRFNDEKLRELKII